MSFDHSTDPLSPRRINVTIKTPESKRYAADNPWLTFEGASPNTVKALIVEAFGLTDVDELTLSDVVTEAQKIASAVSNASNGLGGRVIGEGKSTGSAWEKVANGETAPAKEGPSDEEVERARLLGEVEKVDSIAALQELWARNQEAFKHDDLMNAYKAKGKALSS